MSTSTTTLREPARLVQWAQTSKGSAMHEVFSLMSSPGLLSFALGMPATELLPLAACRAAAAQTLATDHKALQYQMGPEPLKRHLRELLASRGVNCREDQIYLTTGAQQAIHLLVNLLLNKGDQVLIEEVTYEGLHNAILPWRPQVLIVPTDPATGMNVDAVEAQLVQGARPAFIYSVTDGQNPLGISLSQAARNRLVELARHFHIPIIEDDVFGFLNYDGPALPPMRALDEEWVFYIGSFSKILSPALRLGWIVAPDAFGPALSFLKKANDLDVATLAQLTVSTYLDTGELPAHLAVIRREYGIRRDTMLRALESHFPPEAQWKKPGSGMFIWVELPGEINTVELLRMAVETERVAFMPGASFGIGGSGGARNGMRLNFTHCAPEQIQDGMLRLANVLKELILITRSKRRSGYEK
jgi:2-aminoadipate transaminase